MRILIATDFYLPWAGGPATFIENFCGYLVQHSHRVDIVAPSVTGIPALERHGELLVHRVPTVRFPFGHDLRLTLRFDAVRHVVLGARPDVVQVHHPFPLSAAALLTARAAGIPSVAVNHTIPECFFFAYRTMPVAYPVAIRLFRRYLVSLLGLADCVSTPTSTAARLLKDAGFSGTVHAISNGINTDRFTPAHNRAELRARLGLPNLPIVLYIGRLDPEKDMATWIEAAALVLRTRPAYFVIGGTGTERLAAEQRARELGIARSCTFLGFVPEAHLPEYYAAADVYCITGTVELQSISTLEAMASGLPIVAANAAALPELVRNGINGWLAEPGNAGEFAGALLKLLGTPETAAALGRESRSVAERHAFSSVAGQHLRLLQQAARYGSAADSIPA